MTTTTNAKSNFFLNYQAPNHTPGPWTLGTSTSANPHGDFEVFGADYGFYTTGRVAVVDSRAGNASSVKSFSPQTQRLTAEANARLIASSPILLEALVHIAFLADHLPASDITAEIKQTAVSAIAKAQG